MTNTIYIHQPEKAFSFTRLPNFLFEAPTFQPLSNEAKLLYAWSAGQSYPARMGGQIKRDNRRSKKRVSRTDPESGHMKRPGKPEGLTTSLIRRWMETMALSQG